MSRKAIILLLSTLLGVGLIVDTFAGEKAICRKETTFTESFEGGTNEGKWTFGIFDEAIRPVGGSHGDALITTCLSNPCIFPEQPLVTFAPRARTRASESEFTGNLRAKGVTEVSADFRLYRVSFNTFTERPLSLVLVNFNGTPEDITDDMFVFLVGQQNIPRPSPEGQGGWVRYTFEIPTGSPTLPTPVSMVEWDPGWGTGDDGEIIFPAGDPDAVWNTVIEDVDQMIFWWHDPRLFAIIQDWKVAMDNPAIAFCSD